LLGAFLGKPFYALNAFFYQKEKMPLCNFKDYFILKRNLNNLIFQFNTGEISDKVPGWALSY